MTKTTTRKTKSVTLKANAPKVKSAPKEIEELPNRPLAFEVLHLVSKERTKARKIQVLKKYEDISLKII